MNDENETKIIKTWEQIAKFSEYVNPSIHGKSESICEEIVSDEKLFVKSLSNLFLKLLLRLRYANFYTSIDNTECKSNMFSICAAISNSLLTL